MTDAFETEEDGVVLEEVASKPPSSAYVSDVAAKVMRSVAPGAPKKYLIDRCDGKSKLPNGEREDDRPPLRPCLPPPCVKWFPGCLEQNACCLAAGKCGLIRPDNHRMRRIIFMIAIASNVIGFILTIVACCAISNHFDTIMRTAFSSGTGTSDNSTIPGVEVGIGLTAVAVGRPGGTPREVVWSFQEFCERGFKTGTLQYFGDGVCSGCAEESVGLVSTLILSLITYFPNIFTGVTRMYYNYDVNCQKMFGTLSTLFSLFLSFYTWQRYINSCFSVFYEGIIPYGFHGQALAPEEVDEVEERWKIMVSLEYAWRAGPGLICVVMATFLKIVDLLCNMMVPTPTITRKREEQEEYEKL